MALGAGSVSDEANTVSVGSAALNRRVTHVAPGLYGTDAVNVNQLNNLGSQMKKKINQQVATTLAMIQTVSTPYKPGKCRLNVGVGVQGSQAGYAMGIGCLGCVLT